MIQLSKFYNIGLGDHVMKIFLQDSYKILFKILSCYAKIWVE